MVCSQQRHREISRWGPVSRFGGLRAVSWRGGGSFCGWLTPGEPLHHSGGYPNSGVSARSPYAVSPAGLLIQDTFRYQPAVRLTWVRVGSSVGSYAE